MKVRNFPCPKCKKLTGGKVLHKEEKEKFAIVKILTDCCNSEFSEYFTEYDLHRYLVADYQV